METDHSAKYFIETIEQTVKDTTRVEIDSIKSVLSQQRRLFRANEGKKEFVEKIQSSHFQYIYESIGSEMRKLKERHKHLKESLHSKKEMKRKQRRDCQKQICEILKLKQTEIRQKHSKMERLKNETNALINNLKITNKKYEINSLIDERQCKNILNAQTQILNESNTQVLNELKSEIKKNKQINNELSKTETILNQKIQSINDQISVHTNENNKAEMILRFENSLLSMQRLLNIQRFERNINNQIFIEYKCVKSDKIYKIFIGNNIEIINETNTKLKDLCDFILSKYKNNNFIHFTLLKSFMKCAQNPRIARVLTEILLCLTHLNERYFDIRKLYEMYGSNNENNHTRFMLPWFEQNREIVFKFSFKQTEQILVDIPLVISLTWDYHKSNKSKDILKIEHYNCRLNEMCQNTITNASEIEQKWKIFLESVVNKVKGKFQNDIISFVQFIYNQLQTFAEI